MKPRKPAWGSQSTLHKHSLQQPCQVNANVYKFQLVCMYTYIRMKRSIPCIYIYIHMYIYTHIYIYICKYVCVCTYTHLSFCVDAPSSSLQSVGSSPKARRFQVHQLATKPKTVEPSRTIAHRDGRMWGLNCGHQLHLHRGEHLIDLRFVWGCPGIKRGSNAGKLEVRTTGRLEARGPKIRHKSL